MQPAKRGLLQRNAETFASATPPHLCRAPATALAALDHALNALHEAPLDPAKPGGPRFHVTGHQCVQSAATIREHLLNLAVPATLLTRLNPKWQITPNGTQSGMGGSPMLPQPEPTPSNLEPAA